MFVCACEDDDNDDYVALVSLVWWCAAPSCVPTRRPFVPVSLVSSFKRHHFEMYKQVHNSFKKSGHAVNPWTVQFMEEARQEIHSRVEVKVKCFGYHSGGSRYQNTGTSNKTYQWTEWDENDDENMNNRWMTGQLKAS